MPLYSCGGNRGVVPRSAIGADHQPAWVNEMQIPASYQQVRQY